MNAADLPPELAQPATSPGLIDAVRAIAQGPLAGRAYAIDRGATTPRTCSKQLAAAGAMSAHLDKPTAPPATTAWPSWPWPRPPRSAAPPAS
jgi:hypothetical protein